MREFSLTPKSYSLVQYKVLYDLNSLTCCCYVSHRARAVGGGIAGVVISGVADFVGSFGFGAGAGIRNASALGSAIGTIGGPEFR